MKILNAPSLTICCLACLMLSGPLPTCAQPELARLFPDSGRNRAPVIATFTSTQLINSQSNETRHRHDLVFIVQHRFGDIAGKNGGIKNFFGLDNSSDIQIGFEYGITDRWTAGTGRTKGAPNGVNTFLKQLYYINMKYRLLEQTADDNMPFSLTLFGNMVVSAMAPQQSVTADAHFTRFSDRLGYTAQLILARKFSRGLSLAIQPSFIRRNYVMYMDMNNLFAIGLGGRVRLTPSVALLADYFLPFRKRATTDYYKREKDFAFYDALGVGLEIETGGHVFNLSFTNATAILENQFIPSTSSTWTNGGFRWGFSISRVFTLFQHKSPEDAND